MPAAPHPSYASEFEEARNNPRSFWAEAAQDVRWTTTPKQILDDSNPPFYHWFPDGELNTCDNCVDRHVDAGRGNQPALIYDSPVTGTKRIYTFAELQDEVARFAGVLAQQGVVKGDRVIIYMPMIPEAVISMLACARIGAIHSVVFGGFAGAELAKRIDDAKPKLVLSASCGIEPSRVVEYKPLLDKAFELAEHAPEHSIIFQRDKLRCDLTPGRDLDWSDLLASAEPVGCVPVKATDPLYVLYTSGTTGTPKGVVRDNGGHAVALNWSMKNIYDAKAGDVYWAASDVGWVVGHSYIVYAPLLAGCTTVLYEGKPVGTPDAGAFWRVISEHKVEVFFTAPTAFRAIKKVDPEGKEVAKYDLSHFRIQFLAGERCDPDTANWAHRILGVPVVDHWWQTETAWPNVANPMGIESLDIPVGSAGRPVPGYNVEVLGDDGKPVPAGEMGDICVRMPLPPGCLPTLWNNDERFISAYLATYEGYYRSGDAGYIDEKGNVYVMSRIDDIINVAGHRLSTGAMEQVLAAHPDVAEAVVIGVADAEKGQIPVGLVVTKAGVDRTAEELQADLVALMREQIGPVAAFKRALLVDTLPKTRSGKVVRGTLRDMASGKDWKAPATIEDPAVLEAIRSRLIAAGFSAS